MKKLLAVMLALFMVFSLVGCGNGNGGNEGGGTEPTGGDEPTEKQWSAVFITSTPRGNEFTDLIWSGLVQLGDEGWKVDCIETFETAEITEQVRASVANGYDIIYTQGDDVMTECKNLMSEIRETNPDTWFVYLDTYEKTEDDHTVAVTIDPFESCFIAGYVAANQSETHELGLMLPMDTPIMARFEYGYYAGAEYADAEAGMTTTWHKGKTNDWLDTTKGYEATNTLLGNYPNIDILVQCAYISGYGVIQAAADAKIPCIGVDDWQGDIDPIVFWSAIKSMDVAVYQTGKKIQAGEDVPKAVEYDLDAGGYAYADVDLKNLKEGLADKVVQLKQDIIDKKVDVFAGNYEEWRETNFDQIGE